MTKLSVLLRLCAVATAVKIKPCVTGDGLVAGFAHHVTTDAGAEVKAFNAYAKWCADQAQVDGHQQETLNASIASTTAAIEKFAAKAENQRLSFGTLWILSSARSRLFMMRWPRTLHFCRGEATHAI